MKQWVEFKKTVQFETEGRNNGPVFEAGSRHEFSADVADRWIRRDAAFVVDGPHPKKKRPAEPPARKRLPKAADVVIPDNWKALDDRELGPLAHALAEPPPANRNEALDIIESELAERAKQKPPGA